jgi:uncharacterized protein (TIGR02284 family)
LRSREAFAAASANACRSTGEAEMANDTVDVLNDLIKTCNDGAKGFTAAANDVKRDDLRQILQTGARRCTESAAELSTLVRSLGAEPATGGSAAGALHRGWAEVRVAVSTKNDLTVLEECESGEDSAKKSYKKALEKTIDASARTVVERQYQGVIENHDRIRALRDSAKAAA